MQVPIKQEQGTTNPIDSTRLVWLGHLWICHGLSRDLLIPATTRLRKPSTTISVEADPIQGQRILDSEGRGMLSCSAPTGRRNPTMDPSGGRVFPYVQHVGYDFFLWDLPDILYL